MILRVDDTKWKARSKLFRDFMQHQIDAGVLVPVELLTADEQATIMYACQHSDAGRLTRPEEVSLVSLVKTLIERIGGDDDDRWRSVR